MLAALVIGILAGHFGWGKRWPASLSNLHPDYLTGLDYLVTEQPDRALDMFLKLMDANADTIETHFALGALYRRRGEVERAIRIHQNLLAREELASEHREQALLALAQDYLRAGVLDRAEGLFQQVSEVPRLRASALDALRGVYERQHDWQQALGTYRQLARIKAAPARTVAAHYLCELASLAIERGDIDNARALAARCSQTEAAPFPRAALLSAQIAEQRSAARTRRATYQTGARRFARLCCRRNCRTLLKLVGIAERDAILAELVAQAESRDFGELKRLVFAAIAADLGAAAPLRSSIEKVFSQDRDAAGRVAGRAGAARARIAQEIGALLAQAEKYRCNECGFSGRSFYWHCPGVPFLGQLRGVRNRQAALGVLLGRTCEKCPTALSARNPLCFRHDTPSKSSRISGRRARHEISSRHQGKPQGNAADRRQAADSICGR